MGPYSQELLPAEDGERLSRDTIFTTLSNQRRRYVIHYLKQHPEQVRIRDLAEQIAAWENGVDIAELTYKQRKRVYTSLHQTHLPKMDDCGIVDYDRDRGHITLTPKSTELDMYLEVVSKDDLPWSEFYLGLSAAALALVFVVWAGILPVGVLPPLGYAALIAVVFGVAAGVHTYLNRQAALGGGDTPVEVGSNAETTPPTPTGRTDTGEASDPKNREEQTMVTATADETDS